MGKYAWTAVIWAVGGLIAFSLFPVPQQCIAPNPYEMPSFISVLWITILGALLILDMTTWENKHVKQKRNQQKK